MKRRRLKLRVHEDAIADAASIAERIGYHNESACLKFQSVLAESFSRLQSMPRIGRQIPASPLLFEELRVYPLPRFRNFLVFYSVGPEHIVIVRILHGATRHTRDALPQPRPTGPAHSPDPPPLHSPPP